MEKRSMEALKRASVLDYKNSNKIPVVVVLDHLRSGHNVGSVFRTADAFLIEAIYLCGYTPKPPHKEVEKTALGATQSVSWKHFETTTLALLDLKKQGYKLIAIDQIKESISLENYTIQKQEKYALVFGCEVGGITQESLNMCNLALEIPQYGTKHSLNVSVVAGIVFWTFLMGYSN